MKRQPLIASDFQLLIDNLTSRFRIMMNPLLRTDLRETADRIEIRQTVGQGSPESIAGKIGERKVKANLGFVEEQVFTLDKRTGQIIQQAPRYLYGYDARPPRQ